MPCTSQRCAASRQGGAPLHFGEGTVFPKPEPWGRGVNAAIGRGQARLSFCLALLVTGGFLVFGDPSYSPPPLAVLHADIPLV